MKIVPCSRRRKEADHFRLFALRFLWLFSLSASLVGVTGCATTGDDEANYSERPWNTPRSWETGLPSNLNEGR